MIRVSQRLRLGLALAMATPTLLLAQNTQAAQIATIATNMGTIEVQLDEKRAPISVKNFVSYVNDGFYDGTIFHRVIDGFMIQGGGFTADMIQKKTKTPIVNEARGTEKNKRGTIAFARTSDPHSATSQFFINSVDNDFLDARNAPDGWGYAVFGNVISGMDVVDKISASATTIKAGMRDVPVKPVVIESIKIHE